MARFGAHCSRFISRFLIPGCPAVRRAFAACCTTHQYRNALTICWVLCDSLQTFESCAAHIIFVPSYQCELLDDAAPPKGGRVRSFAISQRSRLCSWVRYTVKNHVWLSVQTSGA